VAYRLGSANSRKNDISISFPEGDVMVPRLKNWQDRGRPIIATACLLVTMVLALPRPGVSQAVREREEIGRVLTLEKVSIAAGAVSGEILNRSPNAVRDVQLFIRHTWLWDNETKPGNNDPGTSVYQTLPNEILPGGRLPFTYTPSPQLPKTAGGRFETTVAIAGYTEIISQSR
jgi:hypothetical protein